MNKNDCLKDDMIIKLIKERLIADLFNRALNYNDGIAFEAGMFYDENGI